MTETNGQATPSTPATDTPATSTGNGSGSSGRSSMQTGTNNRSGGTSSRRRNNNNWNGDTIISGTDQDDFEGDTPGLGVVLGLKHQKMTKKVHFDIFRDKLAHYVKQELKNSSDIFCIIKDFTVTTISKPKPFTADELKDGMNKSIHDEHIKVYVKRETTLGENLTKLYSIIWGQCTAILHENIKGLLDYNTQSTKEDCIWLLKAIKEVSAGIDNTCNKYENLLSALHMFINMHQGQTESNDDYLRRFKSNLESLIMAGGGHFFYSCVISSIEKHLATKKEIEAEEECFKAMCFLKQSDPQERYGDLIKSLQASMDVGRDEFPKTVQSAYRLLVKHSKDVTSSTSSSSSPATAQGQRHNNVRVMFAQQGTSSSSTPVSGRNGTTIDAKCYSCQSQGHLAWNCPS